MDRRSFLGGLAAILACKVAPAAVGSGVLMPVKEITLATYDDIRLYGGTRGGGMSDLRAYGGARRGYKVMVDPAGQAGSMGFIMGFIETWTRINDTQFRRTMRWTNREATIFSDEIIDKPPIGLFKDVPIYRG